MRNKPFPLDVTSPQPSQLASEPEGASTEEQSLTPAVIVVPVNIVPETEQIDFNWLRNLLFSIRDNSTYCPLCRCPEWSSQYPDMRTSHYEGCNLGLACEQLLRLYPKENAVIKWRK